MCSLVEVVALATQLAAADPAVCDRGELADRGEIGAAAACAGSTRSMPASPCKRPGSPKHGACEAPVAVLTGDGRRSTKDAEAAVGRAGVCDLLPGVHDALGGRGRCQQGTPTRLARVTRDLDDAGRSQLQELEATLVESAATSSVEAFERQVRDLGRILSRDDGVANHERLRRQRSLRRWVDRNTGMCHTHLQLDPEADAKVSAALDAAIAAERATA